jgi:hypothetical protein
VVCRAALRLQGAGDDRGDDGAAAAQCQWQGDEAAASGRMGAGAIVSRQGVEGQALAGLPVQ